MLLVRIVGMFTFDSIYDFIFIFNQYYVSDVFGWEIYKYLDDFKKQKM